MVTDAEYAEALRTVKQFREERGMDFYMPINTQGATGIISIAEFQRYNSLKMALEPLVPDKKFLELRSVE